MLVPSSKCINRRSFLLLNDLIIWTNQFFKPKNIIIWNLTFSNYAPTQSLCIFLSRLSLFYLFIFSFSAAKFKCGPRVHHLTVFIFRFVCSFVHLCPLASNVIIMHCVSVCVCTRHPLPVVLFRSPHQRLVPSSSTRQQVRIECMLLICFG